MLRGILSAILLLCSGGAAADNCDNLRNNTQAYRDCVYDYYGRSNRGNAPTPWWKNYDPNAGEKANSADAGPSDFARQAEAERKAGLAREEAARNKAVAAERARKRDFDISSEGTENEFRRLTVLRTNLIAANAAKKGALNARDYEDLIASSYPQWDLMAYWAGKAEAQLTGRFRILNGLVRSMGCPEVTQLERKTNWGAKCPVHYRDEAIRVLHDEMKTASKADRVLICFADYVHVRGVFTEQVEERARRERVYQSCLKNLGDVPVETALAFNETAFSVAHGSDVFFMFFNPVRESLRDFSDVQAILRWRREASYKENLAKRPYEHIRREIAEAAVRHGDRLDWSYSPPAMPFEAGPATVRQLNLARPPGGKSYQFTRATPHDTQLVTPQRWTDWEKSIDGIYDTAFMYHQAGKPAFAALTYDVALDIAQTAGPPNNPRISEVLNMLGVLFGTQGRKEEAELLYRRAIAVGEAAGNAETVEAAQHLSNLGTLLFEGQRVRESETLHRRAIGILEKRRGAEHPQLVGYLTKLSFPLRVQGQSQEAVNVMARALRILEKTKPADPRELASVHQFLGAAYREAGDFQKAELHINQTLAIRKQTLPADHADIGFAYESLAKLYRLSGRQGDAEQAQKMVDAIKARQK